MPVFTILSPRVGSVSGVPFACSEGGALGILFVACFGMPRPSCGRWTRCPGSRGWTSESCSMDGPGSLPSARFSCPVRVSPVDSGLLLESLCGAHGLLVCHMVGARSWSLAFGGLGVSRACGFGCEFHRVPPSFPWPGDVVMWIPLGTSHSDQSPTGSSRGTRTSSLECYCEDLVGFLAEMGFPGGPGRWDAAHTSRPRPPAVCAPGHSSVPAGAWLWGFPAGQQTLLHL